MPDNNDFELIRLEFEDVKQPITRENKTKGFVAYGDKNDYPDYLLDMFDRSSKHGAIVRGKANFISGKGFAFVDENTPADDKANQIIKKTNNSGESLSDVTKKVALDLELFGGAYLEVLYSKKGLVSEIYHVDFSKIRVSKDLKKFYFSEEWTKEYCGRIVENSQPVYEEIPAFNAANPKGKQILYIREYTPKMSTYPKPNYFASLRYIQIDILISEYHLNGISNGMFASKMINFNNGVPEEPQKKIMEKQVNGKFAGAGNAGKIMLTWNKNKDNAPTILDLSGTEIDKHFDLLNKTVQQEIFSGHRVTSGMLFGIKTEGQLGGRTEIREAFELFQNTYVNDKRELIEKNINVVLGINGIPTVYIQRSEPIGYELSQTAMESVLSEDEKREMLGRKPRTQEEKTAGNTPAPSSFNADGLDDEKDFLIFTQYGTSRQDYDIVESRKLHSLYADTFAVVADLTETQKSIIDLLTKDPKTSPDAIAKVLSISTKAVEALIKGMISDELISVESEKSGVDEVIKRTPTKRGRDGIDTGGGAETTSIKIMYSYEGPKDSRNRPFCRQMLDLDRFYNREEIEQISSRVGYSVWDRRGGWYKPAGATEARPYCRHSWNVNTVIEKKKN